MRLPLLCLLTTYDSLIYPPPKSVIYPPSVTYDVIVNLSPIPPYSLRIIYLDLKVMGPSGLRGPHSAKPTMTLSKIAQLKKDKTKELYIRTN